MHCVQRDTADAGFSLYSYQETEGGVQPEEQPEAEPPVDPLTGYCMDDIKSVLGEVTAEMISHLQVLLLEACLPTLALMYCLSCFHRL